MKYRVSLLPEKNRKRIIGKKKAVKAKSVALVVLLVLLANVLILTLCYTFAQTQKSKIVSLNNEYAQKVTSLQKYRDINNNLQKKIGLIKSIQVKEPALYNFVATIGNLDHPGISVDVVDCVDWKFTRTCTVTGKAQARQSFNEFMEKLEEIESFKSVSCTSYVVNLVEGKNVADFTVVVTCDGGSTPTVTETEATTTAEDTTAVE